MHLRGQSSSLQDTVCVASPSQPALFPELQRLVLVEDPRSHDELQVDQFVHALHSAVNKNIIVEMAQAMFFLNRIFMASQSN